VTPHRSSSTKTENGGLESAVSIRHATEADAEAIAQLSATLGYATPPDLMSSRLRAILASETDLVIVALASTGAVVGWLQGHAAHIIESGFRVEITGLIVSPEVRQSGIGRALVAEAERWARAKGAGMIVVRSNVQRVESHAFYPALGYARTKHQVVYRKVLESG
jgi:predicted N-acetyltransferase YhbS